MTDPSERSDLSLYGIGTGSFPNQQIATLNGTSREQLLQTITQALIENRPLDEALAGLGVTPSNPNFEYGTYTIGVSVRDYDYAEGETPSQADVLSALSSVCSEPVDRAAIMIGYTQVNSQGQVTVIFSEYPGCPGL